MKNYAQENPQNKLPFSSKSLDKCYKLGGEKFDWSRWNPKPRSTKSNGQLVGLGMASATRGSFHFNAEMRVKLNHDGTFSFNSSTPEQGCGSYTVLPQIAADALSVPIQSIDFEIGDTDFARAPIAAGSATITTVGNAVWLGAKDFQKKLATALVNADQSPYRGAQSGDFEFADGKISCKTKPGQTISYAEALRILGKDSFQTHYHTNFDDEKVPYTMQGFGAHFAEVHVDPDFGVVRVARMVSVISCGKVMNELTCRSQVVGAMIWGISLALMEQSIVDERTGRVMNADLAEYHIPVNADIHNLEAYFVEEHDAHIGPLGAKGVGEIGIAGVPAAICNAVYNATGKRVRDLPITLDKLLV